MEDPFFSGPPPRGGRPQRLRRRRVRTPVAVLSFAALLASFPEYASAAPENGAGPRFRDIQALARQRADEPYRQPEPVPELLRELSYDAWRDIRFDPDRALWKEAGLPFTLQFFHPGFYYDQSVKVRVVDGGRVAEVPFSPDLFDYGRNDFKDRIPQEVGFAGFRIHYPINRKEYHDEVAVFLGASYLRSLAKGQQYGLSARGLAVDTARPAGEEFPRFTEFWIFRPRPTDTEITLMALLDSPSLSGAYLFTIRPGTETTIRVRSKLFPRRKIDKLGIAAMSSMFFFGENSGCGRAGDFRPEVHDSDGLLVAFRTGEWLWRPLSNPPSLRVYSFQAPDPLGFGLFQRDRNFDHYQDLEARYEDRPSLWVQPSAKWGAGHVELIEIPTDSEFNDNIVAFWVPEDPPGPGESRSFDYTMVWSPPGEKRPPAGRVVSTRIGRGTYEGSKKFVIDFGGGDLESFPADKPITAVVSLEDRRRLLEQQLYKNRVTGGWRLVIQVQPDPQGPLSSMLPKRGDVVELRAFLKDGRDVLTETWSYAFEP